MNFANSVSARVVCALVGLGAVASVASAVVLPFSEPDFEWYNAVPIADPYLIWNAGDYWRQTFNGTGLPDATNLALDIDIQLPGNVVENLDLDVVVNSVKVGSFTLTPADTGFQHYEFAFAPIAGDSYQIAMVATSTISSGAGSYGLNISIPISTVPGQSRATLTYVPAPASLALLGIGGLALARRRR